MRKLLAITGWVLILLVLSCVSAPQPPAPDNKEDEVKTEDAGPAFPETIEVAAGGQDPSLLGAMQGAKADAIRQGVIELIGASKERDNHDRLQEILYDGRQQNSYVTMLENTRKTMIGEEYLYEGMYEVNLVAIESTLKAQGIIGQDQGAADAGGAEEIVQNENNTVTADDISLDEVEYEAPTNEEMQFIARYVDRMSFVAYFSEHTEEDPKYIRAGIASANQFLVKNGFTVIDLAQVEKLKQDQQLVYEEETGESMSIIQWIAQKLNADIYVEIDGTTEGQTRIGGDYTATATVSAKAFEASTGTLVGQAIYNLGGKGMYSKVSEEAARISAIESVIYSQIMDNLVKQIQDNMAKVLLSGIRYEVIFQNPPNDRVMSKFWKKVKPDIEAYELEYQTATEIKYFVWKIGGVEELKEAFYDASESVSGLEDMYAVLVRGKSITFNSGL